MFHGIRELLELDAGYTGICRRLLNEAAASVGDEIIVVTRRGEYRGTLLMRYEMGAQDRIVLKLANGYNIGVKVWEDSRVIRIAKSTPPAFRPVHPLPALGELPKVAIVSTGGTIASRIDYRTGGVRPALSASDLLTVVPELSQIAQISTEVLMSIYSENMTAQHWTVIAEKVDELIRSGVDGVVIAHGTDTMGYTAAALSFALLKPPIPIVIVGSQRSSDRPSSDAAINLIAAVDFAGRSPVAEVCVCMHDGYSDEVISIHRGTRVVKLHTSSRSAFKSINSQPIAFWTPSGIRITSKGLNPRRGEGYSFSQFFDDRAILVKYHPSLRPEVLLVLRERLGVRGFIVEGTGLGHVASSYIDVLKDLTEDGVFVGMTSQCRNGRVNMLVYDNGRDLMRAGATPLEDILPETALVKLMWVLGRLGGSASLEDVKRLMLTNLSGEISPRTLPELGGQGLGL